MKKTAALMLIPFLAAVVALSSCGSSGPKIVLDPESHDFYETARLIMTGQEKVVFNHLPDAEARKEFIDEFWAKRARLRSGYAKLIRRGSRQSPRASCPPITARV